MYIKEKLAGKKGIPQNKDKYIPEGIRGNFFVVRIRKGELHDRPPGAAPRRVVGGYVGWR